MCVGGLLVMDVSMVTGNSSMSVDLCGDWYSDRDREYPDRDFFLELRLCSAHKQGENNFSADSRKKFH